MGLQISYDITVDANCLEFGILETTGLYSLDGNIGGYETPNPSSGDVTAVSIVVTNPTGGITTLDPFPASLPQYVGTNDYIILNTMLGYSVGEKLPDGLWTITFNETIGTVYSRTYYVLVDCAAQCCIDTLLLQVTSTECESCNNKVMDKATQAYMFLQVARTAADKLSPVLAKAMFANVQSICANFNCNSCN